MEISLVTTLLLPAALGIIMLGLGLHLHTQDFSRVLRSPKPLLLGLVVQMAILPPIAWLLCLMFALPSTLAVGLMLLAVSPGGATANVFSHLARGDVALNISLTAINSVMVLFTLPVVVSWSLHHFIGMGTEIPAPFSKIVEVAALILLPVAIGMLLRTRSPALAARLERIVQPLSLAFLLALIVWSISRQWPLLLEHGLHVGSVCLCLNLASLAVGYGGARLFRLPRPQAVAIAFEVGIHNSALAIFIALVVLEEPAYSIPAAIYSLLMYFTAGSLTWWLRRQGAS